MVGFWGRRKREADERQGQADDALSGRARTALVTADERIRATDDELAFATAELGDAATEDLRAALAAVRQHLGEAFQLHQLNHDEIPDTPEELRTRNARIVQLCDWAEDLLDERTEALRVQVERVREAPRVAQNVRDDVDRLRNRLPETRDTIARLGERYSSSALHRIRLTADEAEQLLDFAVQSVELSERRRTAGRAEDANLALETATESVRRATSVLDGVDGFEVEAIRAQSTLAEVIDDSREDLVRAARLPRTPALDAAMRDLDAALSTVSGARGARDPHADLSAVSQANAALDAAVERAQRPLPSLEHVRHDVNAADRALGVADQLINGHRGWIGADARTRFAEAQRLRSELDPLVAPEDTRERAQELARRTTQLADEAVRLAQRDIDSARPDDDDWGPWSGGRGHRGGGPLGGGGASVLGPVLGGVLLGGLLDDIFD